MSFEYHLPFTSLYVDSGHKFGTRQAERDVKKDHILELYGIPLVRLSTIGSNEKKVVVDKLSEVLHLQ